MFLTRIRRDTTKSEAGFPWNLPMMTGFYERPLEGGILFFVGENGSGKSTLLEALAIASRRIAIGRNELEQEATLEAIRPFARSLKLGWSRRTGKGFFLRAEDFFGFARRNAELVQEFDGYIDRFRDDDRVRGYMEGNKRAINARYGRDLNDFSHGESFLEFFKARIVPGGLYLIDEPEAALSPQRQLAFAYLVEEMAKENCQFIIATHSPIILSCPEAEIWSFGQEGIRTATYNELDHVQFMKRFLAAPERFWRELDT